MKQGLLDLLKWGLTRKADAWTEQQKPMWNMGKNPKIELPTPPK